MLTWPRNKMLNLKCFPEIFVKLSEMFHESDQILISANLFITATGI